MEYLENVRAYASPPTNAIGTALFGTYVALALSCTTAITISLLRQYSSISSIKPGKKEEDKQLKEIQNARKRHIKIYAFLASVSFATLSYHMLRFLATSYDEWATSKWLLIRTLNTDHLRGWMWDSTLFQSFAQQLVGDGASTVWTQAAILATWFWNIWMAEKGKSSKVGDMNMPLTQYSSKTRLHHQDNGAIHPAQPDSTNFIHSVPFHHPTPPRKPRHIT
jgi:hypothetical protein